LWYNKNIRITNKKMKKITQAISFLALAWISFSLGGTSSAIAYGSSSEGGLDLTNSYNLPNGSISGIIGNILNWLLGLFAALGIIGFVISGILYLTSAGDDSQIEKAKTAMMYSILGIIVGLMGFVILQAVNSMLNGSDTNF
jgi:hypothetical protein